MSILFHLNLFYVCIHLGDIFFDDQINSEKQKVCQKSVWQMYTKLLQKDQRNDVKTKVNTPPFHIFKMHVYYYLLFSIRLILRTICLTYCYYN